MSKPTIAVVIGRYIVNDPKICDGKPTLRGTRVLVADVLERVASGIGRESIIEDRRGNISDGAIEAAIDVAGH